MLAGSRRLPANCGISVCAVSPCTRPREDPATVDVWMYARPGPDCLTPILPMSTQKDVHFLLVVVVVAAALAAVPVPPCPCSDATTSARRYDLGQPLVDVS